MPAPSWSSTSAPVALSSMRNALLGIGTHSRTRDAPVHPVADDQIETRRLDPELVGAVIVTPQLNQYPITVPMNPAASVCESCLSM